MKLQPIARLGAFALAVSGLAAALFRPLPLGPPPSSARTVVDLRGRPVKIATPLGTQAIFMGIGFGPYLLVTRDPAAIVACRSSETSRVLASPYLRAVFPDLAGVRDPLGSAETGTFNLETLLRLRPGVVVTWARLADGFERVGLPTAGVLPLASTARLAQTTLMYASIVGEDARGTDIVARSRALRSAIADDVARHTATRPRLLFLLPLGALRWQAAAGFPDVVAEAGGVDLGADLSRNAFLDAERVIALAPDVIVIIGAPAAAIVTPARLMAMPALAAVPAVRARRVYAFPPGVSGHMGTTMEQPIVTRWLADVLHPERPPEARAMMARVYASELGTTPPEAEIDRDLAANANAASLGGGR